jgi:two-component system KDP operon response regulator KdpE
MKQQRILLIDDDPKIVKFVKTNLEARDYELLIARGGLEALQIFREESPDLVILDIMLPGIDGFEVCTEIRNQSQVPIIMLSARGDTRDKVQCLSAGADDYVTKPFDIAELVARIRTILRRNKSIIDTPSTLPFECGDLVIDFDQRQAVIAGKETGLTRTEYSLLEELALNAGKVVRYDQLLRKVWGPEYGQEKEYVHVTVGHLRSKLEPDPTKPKYIINTPGIGYMLEKNV